MSMRGPFTITTEKGVTATFTPEEAELLSVALICGNEHDHGLAALFREQHAEGGSGSLLDFAMRMEKRGEDFLKLNVKLLLLLVEGKVAP